MAPTIEDMLREKLAGRSGGASVVAPPAPPTRAEYRQRMMGEEDAIIRKRQAGQYLTPREERIFQAVAAREAQLAGTTEQRQPDPWYLAQFEGQAPDAFAGNTPRVDPGLLERERMDRFATLRIAERNQAIAAAAAALPEAQVQAVAKNMGLRPDKAREYLARKQVNPSGEIAPLNPGAYGQFIVGPQHALADRIPGIDPMDGVPGGLGQTIAAGVFDVGAPIAAGLVAGATAPAWAPGAAAAALPALVGLYGVARTEKSLEQGDDVIPAIGKGILTMVSEGVAGGGAAKGLEKLGNATMRRFGDAMVKRDYSRAATIARGAFKGAGMGGAEEFSEGIFETFGENVVDALSGKITLDEAVQRIGRDALPNATYGALMGAIAGGAGGAIMGTGALNQAEDIADATALNQAEIAGAQGNTYTIPYGVSRNPLFRGRRERQFVNDRSAQRAATDALNPNRAQLHRTSNPADVAEVTGEPQDGAMPNLRQRRSIDGRPTRVVMPPLEVDEQERKRAMTEWSRANPELFRTMMDLVGRPRPQRANSMQPPAVDKATALAGVQEWAQANPDMARQARESLGEFGLSLYDVPDINMPAPGPASSMPPNARRRRSTVDLSEAKQQALRDWAAANPERAATARELFNPSRNEFRDLQITGKWTAEERAAAMELLRSDLAEQIPATGTVRTYGPEGAEIPDVPDPAGIPVDLDADPNTAEREAAAQDLFNPMLQPADPEMEAVTSPSEVEPEPEPVVEEAEPAYQPVNHDYKTARVEADKMGLPVTGGKKAINDRINQVMQNAGEDGTFVVDDAKINDRQIKDMLVTRTDEAGFDEAAGPGRADASQYSGEGMFTFRGSLPAEIKEALQGAPRHVRQMFTVRQKGEGSAMGEEAMAEAGGGAELVEIAKNFAERGMVGRRKYLDEMRGSIPDADWMAFVFDQAILAPDRKRTSTATIYHPEKLPNGSTLSIEGVEFRVNKKPGQYAVIEGNQGSINIAGVVALPVDPGTLNTEANDVDAEPADYNDLDAIEEELGDAGILYNREVSRPMPRYGLFGQVSWDAATGRQQELELATESPADAETRRVRGEQPIDDPDQVVMPGVVEKPNVPERPKKPAARQPVGAPEYKPVKPATRSRPELEESPEKPDLPMPAFLEKREIRRKYMTAVPNYGKTTDGKPTGYFSADALGGRELQIDRLENGDLAIRGNVISRQENQDLYDFVDAWFDWSVRSRAVSSRNESLSRQQEEFDSGASGEIRSVKFGYDAKVIGDAQLTDGTRIIRVQFGQGRGLSQTAAVVVRPGEKVSGDTAVYADVRTGGRNARTGEYTVVDGWQPYDAPFDAPAAVRVADMVAETIGTDQYGTPLGPKPLAQLLEAAGVATKSEAKQEPAKAEPKPTPKPTPQVERSVGALFEQPAAPAKKPEPKPAPKAKTYPPLPQPVASPFTEQHALPEGLNKDGSVPLGYVTVDPETGTRAEVVAQKKSAEDDMQVIMQRIYDKDGNYIQSNISLWAMDAQMKVEGMGLTVRDQAKDMDAFNRRADEFMPPARKPAPKPKPAAAKKEPPPAEPGMLFNRVLGPEQNAIEIELDGNKDAPSLDQMIRSLAKIWDIEIRRGGFRQKGGTQGYYEWRGELIRVGSRIDNETAVAIHEVAHHVDKLREIAKERPASWWKRNDLELAYSQLKALDHDVRYGETPPEQGRAFEGFAEYLRLLMTRDGEAESLAPAFHDYFMNQVVKPDRQLRRQLRATQRMLMQYRDAGAMGRVSAQIGRAGEVDRGSSGSKLRDAMEIIRRKIDEQHEGWLNQGLVFEKFMDDAVANGYKGPKRRLYDEWLSGIGKPAQLTSDALLDGEIVSARTLRPIPNMGPALGVRLAEFGIDPTNVDDFERFVIVRQAIEAEQSGIKTPFEKRDLEVVYRQLYTDNFHRAAIAFTNFNNDLLYMLVDAGVLSSKEAQFVIDRWQAYAPLLRLIEGSGIGTGDSADPGNPLMKRRGSNAKILRPIEATVMRAHRFYAMAMQQTLINTAADIADKTDGLAKYLTPIDARRNRIEFDYTEIRGQLQQAIEQDEKLKGATDKQARKIAERAVGEFFDKVDPEGEGWPLHIWRPDLTPMSDEVAVRRDGQVRLYQASPEFIRALTPAKSLWNMSDGPAKLVRNGLIGTAKFLRMGAVAANPEFILANIARDYTTYITNTEQSLRSPRTWIRPLEALVRFSMARVQGEQSKDEMVRLWNQLGGSFQSLGQIGVHSTRATADLAIRNTGHARRLRAIWASRTGWRKPVGVAESVLDSIQQIVSGSDILPRFAEFEASLNEDGVTSKLLREGKAEPTKAQMVKALRRAAEITTPFQRRGNSTTAETLRQMVPFFGASLQGPANMAHQVIDNPKVRGRLLGHAVWGVMVYLMNRDEDWYKEQADWVRYGFFTFAKDGVPILRIPRSLDYGWWVTSTAEQFAAMWDQDDPEGFADFANELVARTGPAINVPIFTMFMEWMSNYDAFRDAPIVPRGMQGRSPRYQYDDRTTWFAKELGDRTNISPKHIDQTLRHLTGGMYQRIGDWGEWAADAVADPKNINWSRAPLIRSFTYRQPYGKSIAEFYDELDESSRAYQDARFLLREKEPDISDKDLREQTPADVRQRYWRMSQYQTLLNDLRSVKNNLKSDKDKADFERFLIGTSRAALRQEVLETFPPAWKATNQNARGAFEGWIGGLFETATSGTNVNADTAIDIVRELGMDRDTLKKHLSTYASDRFKTFSTRRDRMRQFWKRYDAD